MTNQESPNRPPLWEDEPPEEPRFRRARSTAPGTGRVLPGMPLEFGDPDEEPAQPGRSRFRFEEPRGPWWRPKSKAGRIFLAVGALSVLGGVATVGILLKTYLQRDARFRIAGTEAIEATGLTEVTRAEMLPVFGEDIGRNVFFVPLNVRRKELEQIPWVERATVMRILPDQIRVNIVERRPVAFTRNGNHIGLVDANGVLLSMTPAAMARHHYSFPVLTGIDPGDSAVARRTRLAVYLRLMSELDAGGHAYSEQISEIDLTDPEDARVTMPERGADIVAHFGEDRFLERYQRYKGHIGEWRQQYPQLAAVDLRYDQQVVLQMASGSQASEATPAGEPAAGAEPKPQAGEPAAAAAAKPQAKKPPARLAGKSAAQSSAMRKKAALKKAEIEQRKRAEARRAALDAARRKPANRNPQGAAGASRSTQPVAQGG